MLETQMRRIKEVSRLWHPAESDTGQTSDRPNLIESVPSVPVLPMDEAIRAQI